MHKATWLIMAASAMVAAASCTTNSGEVREISSRATKTLAQYGPSGEIQRCVGLRRMRSIKILEERLIMIELVGDQIYLNQPESACGGATGITRRIEYSTVTGQLCAGDLVRVVENASDTQVGSCILSDFHRLAEKTPA